MAEKEKAKKETEATTAAPLSPEADALLKKAKGFWSKFSRPIIYVGGALILLIGGYLAYKYLYKLPKYEKAKDAVYQAERLLLAMKDNASYPADSVKVLLDGGGLPDGQKVTGLLKIIKEYGGTPVGNLAEYMSGVCYLQTKEYDKAISHLKEFDAENYMYQMATYEMLGNAYAGKNNKDEAFSYFKKAAAVNEKDESATPRLMLNAANYADYIGKPNEAIDLLKKIRDNYGTSPQSAEAQKMLAKLGIME